MMEDREYTIEELDKITVKLKRISFIGIKDEQNWYEMVKPELIQNNLRVAHLIEDNAKMARDHKVTLEFIVE